MNTFCENCNKLVEYKKEELNCIAEIKNKKYEYKRIIAYCKKCEKELFPNEIIDENLHRIDTVFREQENIIKTEEIIKILTKYKIGKKPLSKLLGWGEVTLIRYLDGDVPSKLYSEQLYKLLNNPEYMRELLKKNKNEITEKAYRNVMEALNRSQFTNQVEEKIEIIAQYIITAEKEITPLALQKILYYAQGFYRVFFGKFLFEDNCQAWVHGPVYIKIYEKYKEFKSANIPIYMDYDIEDMIPDEEKEILDIVIKYFGYYNGKALEKMSHFETPWINARKGFLPTETSSNIINKKDIKEYFEKVKDKYNMLNSLDIKKYSEDHFRRVIEV